MDGNNWIIFLGFRSIWRGVWVGGILLYGYYEGIAELQRQI